MATKKQPKEEAALVKHGVDGNVLSQFESIATECNLVAIQNRGHLERALKLSSGMQQLRELMTPDVVHHFCALQGSALGFRTDKDRNGGYDGNTIKEAVIEATLRGVYPVGNEFNIISGRCYVTREGFTRLLREYPGLTDLEIDLGVPVIKSGQNTGAIVPFKAKWKLDKRDMDMRGEIPVKVNGGMGSDAILGKADRKVKARIHNRISGTSFSDGDADDVRDMKPIDAQVVDSKSATSATEQLKQKINGGNGNGSQGFSGTPPYCIEVSPQDEESAAYFGSLGWKNGENGNMFIGPTDAVDKIHGWIKQIEREAPGVPWQVVSTVDGVVTLNN